MSAILKYRIRKNKRGFSLAELLIVVAVIAVLTAISIPIFDNQLEKTRESVDINNIRTAYAECASSCIDGKKVDQSITITEINGIVSASMEVTLTQKNDDWQSETPVIGSIKLSKQIQKNIPVTVIVDDQTDEPMFLQGTKNLKETQETG